MKEDSSVLAFSRAFSYNPFAMASFNASSVSCFNASLCSVRVIGVNMLVLSWSTLKESRSRSAERVLTSGTVTYMLCFVSSVSPKLHVTSLKLIPALMLVLYVYIYFDSVRGIDILKSFLSLVSTRTDVVVTDCVASSPIFSKPI